MQASLFDHEMASRVADYSVEMVHANVEPTWWVAAIRAVYLASRELGTFTTDDVWARLPREYTTHEPRAMGAVMREAVRREWCEGTDQYQASARVVCHGNPKRVWRSVGRP